MPLSVFAALRGRFCISLFSLYLVDVFADISFDVLADSFHAEILAEFSVTFKAVMEGVGESQGHEEMCAAEGLFTE